MKTIPISVQNDQVQNIHVYMTPKKSIPVRYEMSHLDFVGEGLFELGITTEVKAGKVTVLLCQHHNPSIERHLPDDLYTDIAKVECKSCGWSVLEN